MRNLVLRLAVNAAGLWAAAWVVSGIELTGGVAGALLVALVFSLVNGLLKPIATLLSLPFILLSLGLFMFVVNGVMLLVTAALTSQLAVSGLWAAILGSIVMSLVNLILGRLTEDDKKTEEGDGWQ